jgi:osmotically-inducible protein OsmY
MRKENHTENKQASIDSKGATTSNEQRRGNNKGKGPRSYQRSDNRILEQINERLCDNPYLDASDMEVAVQNGVVFLTGTVSTRDEKKLAEEIAEEVAGVENVENKLHITLRGI